MALAFSLAEENLEIKLEFSKRLLGFVLSRPNAPISFVKQVNKFWCQVFAVFDHLLHFSNRPVGRSALPVY